MKQHFIRYWLGIVALTAGLNFAAAASDTYRVTANVAHCVPLSATQQQWLSSEWAPFLGYARVCPIRNPKRVAVVLLVSVRADLYYKAQPGKTVVQVQIPHALLFSPEGELLGSLPHSFPDDPPAEIRVTFAHWEHDFPQQIDLFVTDPREAGSGALPPLVWDPEHKRFVTREGIHE